MTLSSKLPAIPSSFRRNIPLCSLCTLGIGGPALYVCEAKTVEDLSLALQICRIHAIPYIVLGKGSNCLFSDKGFDGAVIVNKIDFLKNTSDGFFHAGAGYSFSLLGVQTARQGWGGLEFASGIPASVGGAVCMNAGANGVETYEELAFVDYVHPDGAISLLYKEDLHFGYRSSPFQTMKGAIAGAAFKLRPCPEARRKQLEIINYRKETQPYSAKSAGCIFRNPQQGHAGALIEKCGLKGKQIGGAKVSDLHANFLVNSGGATAQDMLDLLDFVKTTVFSLTGVSLEAEVKVIPYQQEAP